MKRVADWDDMVAGIVRSHNDVVETACEMALRGGQHGVSVYVWLDDLTYRCEARVDPEVDYGRIVRHPVGKEPPS